MLVLVLMVLVLVSILRVLVLKLIVLVLVLLMKLLMCTTTPGLAGTGHQKQGACMLGEHALSWAIPSPGKAAYNNRGVCLTKCTAHT